MKTTDITNMTVTELKALAFDTLVEIERQQNNLKTINQAITKRQTEEVKPVKTETKTD